MSSMHAFAHDDSSDESSGDENEFAIPTADPGADDFADYNPRKRRRTGRDAKESAALGIFGSESEDDGPGKRWKGKSNLRGKGMSFVSTGQKKTLEEDDDEDDEEEDEDVEMDDDEEEEPVPGIGLRSSASGRGLGFQSPAPAKPPGKENKYDSPFGKGFVPSSAAVPILKDFEDDEKSTPKISRPSAFSSTPGKGVSGKTGAGSVANAGSFAARMMAKMGYKEGQGLGKEGQGRSGVIEVTLRPQGVGLGAVREKSKQEKEEEKRQAKLKGEVYEDSDEERKKQKARRPKISQTGSGVSTPRRKIKPSYRTVAEVEKAAPGLKIPDAFAPILDMTGPAQKLLTSTSGLLTPTAPGSETVEQVESKKLARRAQSDLSAFVEEWKSLQERKAYTEMQMLQEEQSLKEPQDDLEQIHKFAQTVEGINSAAKDGQWDPVLEALEGVDDLHLSTDHDTLSSIAVAAVHPFLRQSSEGWQPLENPKLDGMAPSLFKIRHILGALNASQVSEGHLEMNGSRARIKSTSAYESMIYKIVFPKIFSAINSSWDVHNPTPVLTLLDAWEGLLPPFVRSQILDQAVVGKLNGAVSSWNPKKRRSHELPHLWLFPWLQYLPAHHADPKSSTGLVSDVKRKFRHLIDAWDFHKGLIPGLEQWREVLCHSSGNDHWTPLIMNHVLPSMARFLKSEKNFLVDPNDQAPYMSALQGIFAWSSILKPRMVGQVLIETVFPMWHNVLHQWLTVVGPNEEIGQWFEWWRDEVFPENIKSLPAIQEQFEKGHAMINQALDLGSAASTQLPAPIHRAAEKSPSPHSAAAPPPPPTKAAIPEELSVRHRVEDWCLENDLHFLPEKKVLHDAGPLYRITAAGNGKNGVLVFFKGETVAALARKDAQPLPIVWDNPEGRDALLEMAWLNVK